MTQCKVAAHRLAALSRRGIETKVVKLESSAEVRAKSPTAYGVFGIVCDGRLLTYHYLGKKELRRLDEEFEVDQCYTKTFYTPDGAIHSLGVFALLANKGTTLALVLNRLGLKQQQVMAIGDNLNDLPMFAQARVSVAMSNAPDAVKRKATVIAPSNDKEGVAWTLTAYGIASRELSKWGEFVRSAGYGW